MNSGKVSKKGLIIIIVMCLVFLVFAIVDFILFSNRKEEVVVENKNGGKVVLNYPSDAEFLNIKNVLPITDEVGMISSEDGSYYDFSVDSEVEDAKNVTYEISVKKISGNVNNNDIKVYLEKEDSGTYNSVLKPTIFKAIKKNSDLGTKSGSMILIKEKLDKSTINNYRIRTWLSENCITPNPSYQLELNIVAKAK